MGRRDHSTADVIRNLLINLGVGTAYSADGAWPIYVGREPDKPDSLITVYDTSGSVDARIMETGEVQDRPGIMVRVRANDFQTAYDKIDEIRAAFDETVKRTSVTIGTAVYRVDNVSRRSGPMDAGREPESDRTIFTLNAVVCLRQTV